MTTTEPTTVGAAAPAEPISKPTDVLLASFPRSGNTWMMNILLRSGILALAQDAFRASVVTPKQLEAHAGLFHKSVQVLQERWEQRQLRVIKTHDLPRVWGRRVIYIYRDGRDVATSFFFYLKSRGQIPESTSFSEFLWKDMSMRQAWAAQVSAPDFEGRGPAALWARHVAFWQAARAFKPLHLVRYEKLLEEPLPTLQRLFEFLEVECSDAALGQVIEETRFAKLRESEATLGEKILDASRRFFRSGKSGNWREHFSADDVEPFKEQAGQTLIELGYENDLRWGLD